jgi:hypothetical protein
VIGDKNSTDKTSAINDKLVLADILLLIKILLQSEYLSASFIREKSSLRFLFIIPACFIGDDESFIKGKVKSAYLSADYNGNLMGT